MRYHRLLELRVQRQLAAQDEVPTGHLVVKKPVMTGTVLSSATAGGEAIRSAREFREQGGGGVEKSTYFRILFFGGLAPLLVPLSAAMGHEGTDESPDGQTGEQADEPDDLRPRPHPTPLSMTPAYRSP